MKNKKMRILAVLMAALMLIAAGCGGGDEEVKDQEQNQTEQGNGENNQSEDSPIQDGDLLLMVKGKLYYATGEESENPHEGEADGVVESSVREGGMPEEDDQSNFGYGEEYYIMEDGTIETIVDGLWMVFEPAE